MNKQRIELLEQRISRALTRREINRYFTPSTLAAWTGFSLEEITEWLSGPQGMAKRDTLGLSQLKKSDEPTWYLLF